MLLGPGAFCTFSTLSDTRVDFNQSQVDVLYYAYEGINIDLFEIDTCKLEDNKSRVLPANDNNLKIGLLGGLLSGHCGFFVVVENKDYQRESEFKILRISSEIVEKSGLRLKMAIMAIVGSVIMILM